MLDEQPLCQLAKRLNAKERSMLWNASLINGYAIEASDGPLGTVSDFLFEDASWMIRWLVVDTGNWLSGRKVLLPPSVLGQPDAGPRQFPVKLTMQQVKDSPDVDTDRPVSRQLEIHVYDYYGWDPYWGSGYMSGGALPPPPFLSGSGPRDLVGVDVPRNHGDPHLRSIEAVTGYHIHATDGEIGHVEDFLVDDAGWSVRYVAVDTRNWWPGKKVLISPRSVREFDWPNRLMHLDVDRQKVKDSPAYDPTKTVDQAYEERFYNHYGDGRPGI
jgi:PRC-barrel domain